MPRRWRHASVRGNSHTSAGPDAGKARESRDKRWQLLAVVSCRQRIWDAVRTAIVFALSLTVLWWSGGHQTTGTLNGRECLFLALSWLATAVSSLAYFQALSIGSATPVTAIDKASLVVTMVLAILFLGEPLSWGFGGDGAAAMSTAAAVRVGRGARLGQLRAM